MTEIAIRTPQAGSSLAIGAEQDGFTDKQIAALKQLGVKDATQGDLDVFFYQAQRTGLDPFAKQLYLIGRWSREGTKFTIQTGIDGYRLIARRAVDRSGETLGYEDTRWCGQDGVWTDVWLSNQPPAAARVVVLRAGQRYPATALWSEYVQTVKDGSPNSMWARMGANQLAKCAEALALRKAFPQDLSGIYTTDEMGQAESPQPAREQPAKPTSIREAIGATTLRSEAQSKKLAILLRELGMTNRDEALSYIGGLVNRDVDSTKTLTVAEASTVIDSLQKMADEAKTDHETGEIVDAEIVDAPDRSGAMIPAHEPTGDWPEVRQPGSAA
jgi:phage recombination protein Bet